MFDRFQRSWDLTAECWRLLMDDKILLVPLMSSIAMVLIIGTSAVPLLPAFGLAPENVGALEAIGRSVELIKKSWGENIFGNAGISMVFGAIIFLVGITGGVLVLAAFGNRDWALGIALAVVLVIAVSLIALAQATLQGIYSAALYRFATGDPPTGGIDRRLLENAFRAKS